MPRKIIPQTGPYILTRQNLNPSARILARELGLQKSYEPRNYPPVIRWGNSDGRYERGDTLANSPDIIHICANKLRFSVAMQSLNIPHVEILSGVPAKFPVVVRHNLSGARGIGIEIATSLESIDPWYYDLKWSYWRNFQAEFGVHIFNGEIIRVFRKVDPENSHEEFPIRNSSRGYGFALVNLQEHPKPKLVELIKKFTDGFGMNFGRIDIGWNLETRIYEIIEANSAPGLAENENTASLYVNGFKKLLGKE